MTSRLFIGLDLPTNVKKHLITLRDEIYDGEEQLRWESDDKLHITLKFLGDVGENLSNLLIQRLDNLSVNKIFSSHNTFEIEWERRSK